MEKQAMETSDTYCLIEPKVEIQDVLEITYDCEDNNDFIIPKYELSSSSLHSDSADLDKCDIRNSFRPIKIETILNDNIVQLQNTLKTTVKQETTILDTEDASTGYVAIDIKSEPDPEVSDSANSSQASGASLKCSQILQCRADEKNNILSSNVSQKTCERNSALLLLLKPHTSEKTYSCGKCEAKFTLKANLTTHIKIHSGERPFSCGLCQAKFTRKPYLTKHIMMHTGEKPFSCDLCQAKFRRKAYLITHMMMHSGEKPFACDLCQAKFRRKAYLTIHMKMHSGEKPFSCDVCQAKFTRKAYLTAHMMMHSGEKPFSCNLCLAKFTLKGNLRTHSRIHSGEKRFSCNLCQAKFTQKCSLTKHTQIHTKVP